MSIWDVLGIEKTKDKEAIRNAYREKLVHVNPEENQQGFMELRKSYEEALASADKPEESENDGKAGQEPETPVSIWMKKADALYQDISLRGNIKAWEEFLEDDVCFSLETKTEARNELLLYFMSHYYLPQRIWKLFDKTFLLREYASELYELFPANYVEQGVIGNIENSEYIDIQYIESQGGDDYDGFLDKAYEIHHNLLDGNIDAAKQGLEEIQSFGLYHPYLDIFRVRCLLYTKNEEEKENKENKEKAKKLAEQLMEKLPEDEAVCCCMAQVYSIEQELDKAREIYEKVLETTQYPYNIEISLGNLYFRQEKFKDAKKHFDKAYDIHKNDYVGENILNCIAAIQKECEKEREEHPDNQENIIELARTYYQQSKFEEAMELLLCLQPDEDNQLEYVHLLGCTYMYMENSEKALPYLLEWVARTENLEPDGTEKREKEIKRLTAAYHCTAKALADLKQYGESDKFFDKALGTGIQTIDVYEEKARIYFERRKYDDVIQICNKIFECDNHSPVGHAFKGEAFYELGYYLDSIEEWEHCIQISPNNLRYYIKKADCLYLMKRYDEATEVLRFVKEHGASDDSIVMWDAMIEAETGNREKALQTLLTLKDKANSEEGIDAYIEPRLYYELARLYADEDPDKKRFENFYIRKALEKKPDYIRAIQYQAYMYWDKKKYKEAIDCFQKVLEINPKYIHIKAYARIGEIYEEQEEYVKAIEYYDKQLEIEPDAFCYLSKGWCLAHIYKYSEARIYYKKSLDMDQNNTNIYCHIANTYTHQTDSDLEKAAEYFELAINEGRNPLESWQYEDYIKVLIRMENWERAIEILTKRADETGDSEDREKLADFYMERGYYTDAIREYEKLGFKNYDDEIETCLKIADCMFLEGDLKRAKKMLKKAQSDSCLSEDEDNIKFLVAKRRLYIYLLNNEMLKAKMEYQKLERHGNSGRQQHASDIITLKCQLMMQGKRQTIFHNGLIPYIKTIEKAASKTDVNYEKANRYSYLAIVELAMDNYEKAMEYTEAGLRCPVCEQCKDSSCHEGWYMKGILLELAGRTEEAAHCYEEILKNNRNREDIDYMFAYRMVQKKLGQSKK